MLGEPFVFAVVPCPALALSSSSSASSFFFCRDAQCLTSDDAGHHELLFADVVFALGLGVFEFRLPLTLKPRDHIQNVPSVVEKGTGECCAPPCQWHGKRLGHGSRFQCDRGVQDGSCHSEGAFPPREAQKL